MPNWCDNSIRLSHSDKTKIDALEAVLGSKSENGNWNGEVFNHLYPNPSGEWDYNWSVENWGTKWDADLIDYERMDDNEIIFYCNTAWSPPIALYEYLESEGWEIEAYYHESGCAFCGKWTNEDGDQFYEYDFSDRASIEALPQDIEDYCGLLDYHDSCKEDGMFDEEEVD